MIGFSYMLRRYSPAPKCLWAIYIDGEKLQGAEGFTNLREARRGAKARDVAAEKDVVFGKYREDIGTAPATLSGPLLKRTK